MKKAVSVAIVNEKGQILLEKHVKCKGLWLMPCGKLEENETFESAAVRELKEELGLNINACDLITLFQRNSFYSRIDGDQVFDEKVFLLRYNENSHGKPENLEPEKHTSIEWIHSESVNYFKALHISENTRLVTDMINSGVIPFNVNPIPSSTNFIYKTQSFDLSQINEQLRLINYIVEDDENLTLEVLEGTNPEMTVLRYSLIPTRFLHQKTSSDQIITLGNTDQDLISTHLYNTKYSTLHRKLSNYLEEYNIYDVSVNTIIPDHINEDKIVRFDDFAIKVRKVLGDSEVKIVVNLCHIASIPFKLVSEDIVNKVLTDIINSMYKRYLKYSSRDKVLVTKIHPEAIIPEKAHPTDSGMDLFAVGDYELQPGEIKLIKTGIKIILPEGYEAQVRPKSGLALKQGITVLNTPGTVDEEYRGEVGVILVNHGDKPVQIKSQQKIAQLVISKVDHIPTFEITNEEYLTFNSKRGEGGFGSTGLTSKQNI